MSQSTSGRTNRLEVVLAFALKIFEFESKGQLYHRIEPSPSEWIQSPGAFDTELHRPN